MDPDRIDPGDGSVAPDEAEWLGSRDDFGSYVHLPRGALATLR